MSRRASDGLRGLLVSVMIYSALAIMPVNMPVRDILEPGYPIVQPTDGPVPDLDELVAALASPA